MRSESVRQFVSRPPSQRLLTYGIPTRFASLGDGVLRLLLRAHEEHGAAARCDVGDERVRLLEQRVGLGEVDDVDAAALAEDEPLHLRVPAARLVAEVDAGLQEVLHGHDRHEMCSLRLIGLLPAVPGETGHERPAPLSQTRPPGRLPSRQMLAQAPPASSAGSCEETSTGSPVIGCVKASRQAWRNCRPRPRPGTPYVRSPTTGSSIAARWTRI